MTVLLLADHDGKAVSQPTRSAIAAGAKLGEVHVLVLGEGAAAAAASAAAVPASRRSSSPRIPRWPTASPSRWPRCW